MLTEDQKKYFDTEGFLKLPGFFSAQACSEMRDWAHGQVESLDGAALKSVFSTLNQTRSTDAYFLESGDQVRFFLEEDALDADGALTVAPERAVNKIGHAQHDLAPTVSNFCRTPQMAAVAEDLGLKTPHLLQSMLIFKQPHIGGEVVCHQDATFLYTEPVSVIGFWVALETATVENGCLYALPGGHKMGLKSRFRRTGDGSVTMDTLDPRPWPEGGYDDPYVPLEAEVGTLVVLHGLLPHKSAPNRSDRSRLAFTLHVVEGEAAYPQDNWLIRPQGMPPRGFEVPPAT